MNNNILKNSFSLSHKITVYVPGTVDANTAGDTSAYVTEAAALLSECFGGATSTPVRGYWMSEAHGLIAEDNNAVFAYAAQSALDEHLDDVVNFAVRMRDELKQEAVAVELDGTMYFI